jgi:hypothetical protein
MGHAEVNGNKMQRTLVSGVLAIVLLLVPPLSAAAQSTPCPMASDDVVSTALGGPVQGTTTPTAVSGLDFCDFVDASGTDFGVYRESNAFGPGEGGAAALATRYIPQLPDAVRAQIDALNQIGINIAVPGYEIAAVPGLGDAAIWVKTELLPGTFNDSLIVQQGGDAFSFNGDDSPDAQMRLTALAQAVLANLNQ